MYFILSILLFWLANPTAGFLVPNPPGKYNVTLTTGPLIDYKRNTTYAPTPMPRALMLSVFQPAKCASTVPVPYMPNKTAAYQGPYLQNLFNITFDATPLFLEARLPVCSNRASSCSPLEDRPILLFSPGYAIPRLYYSVIASAIASEGFMVVTIDHPEDSNIITYPDGRAAYNDAVNNNASFWDRILHGAAPRAADASFVIDQLRNATAVAELLPQRGRRPFLTDRIAMLGHSLGGVAAIIAAGQDSRVRGAIDWDGSILEPLPPSGVSRPVMLVSSPGIPDSTLREAWPQFKGPKLWVHVANTTHQSFSDLPALLQAAGLDQAAFVDVLGSIAPARLVKILTTYTTAWMMGAFKGEEGGRLLHGQEQSKFPEVSITRKDNF